VASLRTAIGMGALILAGQCFAAAFVEARKMDALRLPGSSCVGWLLLPEMKAFLGEYTQDFLREVRSQVRQDSWSPAHLKHLKLCYSIHKPPGFENSSDIAEIYNTDYKVSQSYVFVSCL
jgi:hypothetical protein